MALQLIFGGSGAGKSTFIYKKIIDESIKNPDKNYIIVVPEQYTMAIQKRVVELHPNKGILNIDVVSFQRLAFKVFEEVGGVNFPILDDTGKNLIIRRVLEQNKTKMCYFASNTSNTGFTEQMKSVISELLQYDIDKERLAKIREDVKGDTVLSYKLEDIDLIYNGFKKFIDNSYITNEEILDVLARVAIDSKMLKNSTIVLDGFTGFTPVQYRLIRILLEVTDMIYLTLTADVREKTNVDTGMENIFFMTKECAFELRKICDEEHIEMLEDIKLEDNYRFKENKELAFLEANLFRKKWTRYKEDVKDLVIYSGNYPKDEIHYATNEILKLTRLSGFRYSDIAIVTSDMERYGKLTANILEQNSIPYFLDYKRHVTSNPLVEFIRAALEIVTKNFSYDAVMRYLRTSMTDLSVDDIDLIDNYIRAVGIKGNKKWMNPWTRKFRGHINETDLEKLNSLRERIVTPLAKLKEDFREAEGNVHKLTLALYDFLCMLNSEEKIINLGADSDLADEFEKVYALVMDLFDKLVELLGTEKVSLGEYVKILDSGFEEIKIGLIPPSNDCVVIGDINRTRLDDVKVLFFLGVNDGLVPARSDSRSILSETDRRSLESMDVKLSPTNQEKAFVQRYYLYLFLTKASRKLYISYANKDTEGKSILPSYMIRTLKKLYPKLDVIYGGEESMGDFYLTFPKSELSFDDEGIIDTIAAAKALSLYGKELRGSVTSFEDYERCHYAYFLRYGLGLQEREEYSFEIKDFGTIIHSALEHISAEIIKNKMSFSNISDEDRAQLVKKGMEAAIDENAKSLLTDTKRSEYLIKRMTDIIDRSVWTIGKHLESGLFKPDMLEAKFLTDVESMPKDVSFKMNGKIDRVDICEDEDNLYVRVVDYKSGKQDLDLLSMYYGLKIQLITYLREAIELEKRRYHKKNYVPAGILYLNVDNPIVEANPDDSDEIDEAILQELKMKGLVNDNEHVYNLMEDMTDKKEAKSIPIKLKTDGTLAKASKVMSTRQLEMLSDYTVKENIRKANEIIEGNIEINPYIKGKKTGCDYCPYKSICGFSADLSKKGFRRLANLEDKIIWHNIKTTLGEISEEESED